MENLTAMNLTNETPPIAREVREVREVLENHLGCRIVWHASSMRTNAKIQVRFVPLAGLRELVAYWQKHDWGWSIITDIWTCSERYLKRGLYLREQLGEYNRIYLDRKRGFLYHSFIASRTHYLCQHWLDPLPLTLGKILYEWQLELRPLRFIDIVVKDRRVYTPTLDQVLNHYVGGTKGDWNYPFPLLIKHWQNQLSKQEEIQP